MTSSSLEDDAAEVLAGLGQAGPAANDASSPTVCTTASEASNSTRRGGDHRAKSHPSSSSSITSITSAPTTKTAGEDNEVHQSVGSWTAGNDCHHKKHAGSSSSAASISSHDASSSAVSNSRFPVEARVVQFVKISKSRQDHSYRDFSIVPPPADYKQPPLSKKNDESMDHMSFSEKLHDLLAQPAHRDTIRWMSHGRAFRVEVPKNMEKHGILLRYFQHGRYSSFLRQLNNHGFKHLTVGPDRNSYYHECFLRGLPHLCVYMPHVKDARRLIPDPDTEPNFYNISKTYPLPGDVPTPEGAVVYTTKPSAAAMLGSMSPPTSPLPAPVPTSTSCSSSSSSTDGKMPPPQVVVQPQVCCIDRVTPFAAIFNQGSGDIVVPHAAIAHNAVAAIQQQQQQTDNAGSNLMLPPSVLATMAQHHQQQQVQNTTQQTSNHITNSLLAAMTQDTLTFPNNNNNNSFVSPGANKFDDNTTTTLSMLEALLVRQSQVTNTTQKRAHEDDGGGGNNNNNSVHYQSSMTGQRLAKMTRFDPAMLLQHGVPTNIAAPSWPTNDMASASRRLQDVASSLASFEKFRSEAQRLEAERVRTEELQKAATVKALAAQAALLAAILGGQDGSGGTSSGSNNNGTGGCGTTSNFYDPTSPGSGSDGFGFGM